LELARFTKQARGRFADLHDEEVGVVDIELDGLEEVGHPVVLDGDAVDHVLVLAADHHLTSDADLVALLVTYKSTKLVKIRIRLIKIAPNVTEVNMENLKFYL